MKAKVLQIVIVSIITLGTLCVRSQNQLLYLKGGYPATWTVTGIPGNQHEEISQWTYAGYNVQTMNLTTTTITSSLLNGYQVLRLNGELGPRALTFSEGNAIFSWVQNGGKLLADIAHTDMVPAINPFGIQTIEGENGGYNGCIWYFHGSPMVDGPITGPEGGVSSFASSAMDHPVLASNNDLTIDYYKSGYPMIVHGQFNSGKVVIVFTNAWSHDQDWPGNLFQANIFQEDNLEFLQKCIQYFNSNPNANLLYLKGGDPSTWTVTGIPGNQHEEISQWTNAGCYVQTMNLTTTTITSSLLNGYQVLRLNGEGGPRAMTTNEGNAIYTWVQNGGKLLAGIGFTNMVPAISQFGVQTIEGENGGYNGCIWYFHGSPMVDGPITGPEGGVSSFASAAMDHPVLASNNNLIVDYYKSGYPMIVHNQYGSGKVVIIFTHQWSHDQDWPGNLYQANIFQEDNLEFLLKCIQYLLSPVGINDNESMNNVNLNEVNYPNPFNNETIIKFNLLRSDKITLTLYDMSGKEINKIIKNQYYSDGSHEIHIDGQYLLNGIYFLELRTNNSIAISKIVKL